MAGVGAGPRMARGNGRGVRGSEIREGGGDPADGVLGKGVRTYTRHGAIMEIELGFFTRG